MPNGEASAAIKQQVEPARRSFRWSATASSTTRSTTTGIPTSGLLAELRQDFAGVGGDVNFIRTTGDVRCYYELMSDIVSVLRLQGGHVTGWGDKDLRMLDHFQMGPNLVRGFQTAGIGPRDLTLGTTQRRARRHDVLGHVVRGADRRSSACRRTSACDFAVFADAGSVWDYEGQRFFPATATSVTTVDPFTGKDTNSMTDPLVGRRRPHLGFAVRTDPLRLCVPAHQGSERPRAAAPLQRRHEVLILEPRHGQGGMTEPLFFRAPARADRAGDRGADRRGRAAGDAPERRISGIAPLDRAGPGDLAFLQNPKYADAFAATRAGICLTTERFAADAPARCRRAGHARSPTAPSSTVAQKLFPGAMRPSSLFEASGDFDRARWCIRRRGSRSGVTIDPAR